MSERTIELVADPEDEGARADVTLGRRVPELSRRVARRLCLEGRLRVDRRPATASTRIQAGQTLQLRLPDQRGPSFELETLHLSEALVYVRKPPGVHTVALLPDERACLASAVKAQYPECADASVDPREAGAVHRLDEPTSGVVAFARSREAWERGREAFRAGEVDKRYLAAVRGEWPPAEPEGALPGWLRPNEALRASTWESLGRAGDGWEVRAPLGAGEERSRQRVRLDGQRATSVVWPLAREGELTLLEVALVSGRRHQARVHLAWLGCPIVGDRTYGPDSNADTRSGGRLSLHAARLDFSGALASEKPVCCMPDAPFWPPKSG